MAMPVSCSPRRATVSGLWTAIERQPVYGPLVTPPEFYVVNECSDKQRVGNMLERSQSAVAAAGKIYLDRLRIVIYRAVIQHVLHTASCCRLQLFGRALDTAKKGFHAYLRADTVVQHRSTRNKRRNLTSREIDLHAAIKA